MSKLYLTYQRNVISVSREIQLGDKPIQLGITDVGCSKVRNAFNMVSLRPLRTSIKESHQVHQTEDRHQPKVNLPPQFLLLLCRQLRYRDIVRIGTCTLQAPLIVLLVFRADGASGSDNVSKGHRERRQEGGS
jgi:hypothetical protein